MKIQLYHGTSAKNAMLIKKHGFRPDMKYNWGIKSKTGYVYLSSAYAPFYAMAANKTGDQLALIKVVVDTKDIYPEDDFVMFMLGYPKYTQAQLNAIDLKRFKNLAKASLDYMGNVAVKPDKIKIIGIRIFNGRNLLLVCDPVISPINFKIMGDYYKELSDWIYHGNEPAKFKSFSMTEMEL